MEFTLPISDICWCQGWIETATRDENIPVALDDELVLNGECELLFSGI